jgi:hypothetical protein
VNKIRLSFAAAVVGVLLPMAAVQPALADVASPTPLSSIIPAPLQRFTVEIDGVTVGGVHAAVTAAFLAWYTAHPDRVVAFLQFLQDYPVVASYFYAWASANPDQVAALYNALAQAP